MKPGILPLSLLLLCALAVPGQAQAFSLSSPDMAEGRLLDKAQELNIRGCEGGNISPALNWAQAPTGTKSFAVTIFDTDARQGSGWWHWLVFDIPATASGLVSGAGSADGRKLPPGAIQSSTSFGQSGFGGACPPKGDPPHHYQVTVYALDVPRLGLEPSATPMEVKAALGQHTLGQAMLVPLYRR